MTREDTAVRSPAATHAAEHSGAPRTRTPTPHAGHRRRLRTVLAWLPVIAVVILALLAVWQALAANL